MANINFSDPGAFPSCNMAAATTPIITGINTASKELKMVLKVCINRALNVGNLMMTRYEVKLSWEKSDAGMVVFDV